MFEKIMDDIENNAQIIRSSADPAAAAGVSHTGGVNIVRVRQLQAEIDSLMDTLARNKDCTADAPVTSHRFLKRIIRKMTLWLLEPAWQKQRVYNNAVFKTLERMREITKELTENEGER